MKKLNPVVMAYFEMLSQNLYSGLKNNKEHQAG
jgi:hypothetical protein